MLVAAPQQAVAAEMYGGAGFSTPVIAAPSLAAGTVIALEARALASGFSDAPRVDIAKEATIHWEDATPLPLGSSGSPNTVAAPARSAFQTDTYALRLVAHRAVKVVLNRIPSVAQIFECPNRRRAFAAPWICHLRRPPCAPRE